MSIKFVLSSFLDNRLKITFVHSLFYYLKLFNNFQSVEFVDKNVLKQNKFNIEKKYIHI